MALRAASLLAVLLFAAGGCETHKAGAETGAPAPADSAKSDDGQKAAPTKVADSDKPPAPPSEAPPPPAPPSEATPPAPPADDVAPGHKTECAQVIEHVIQLQLTQVPEAQRAQVQQVLPKIRAQGIMECDAKWNSAARKCLLAAKDPKELAPCQALLTQGPDSPTPNEPPPPADDNHPTAPTPDAPTPAAPPVDNGPDCSRVARNVTAILEKTFGDRAGKHDTNIKAFEAECRGWTPSVRQCFLAASNINEAKECSRVQRIDRMH